MFNPQAAQFMQALGQGGMAGQAPQQMAPPVADPAADSYDEAIQAAYQKLNSILPADINYEEKYASLLGEVQNREVPEHPLSTPGGVASSFAFALGSPDKAPGLIREKVQRHYAESDQKESDLMKLKESLLQGAIQQEVSQGNFKAALKQSEALAEIQRLNEDRKRKKDMEDWKTKQGMKAKDALELAGKRAREQAKAYKVDQQLALKILTLRQQHINTLMGQDDLLGQPKYTAEQAVEEAEKLYPFEPNEPFGRAKGDNRVPKEEDKPDAPKAGESPAAAALRRIREAKGKK